MRKIHQLELNLLMVQECFGKVIFNFLVFLIIISHLYSDVLH